MAEPKKPNESSSVRSVDRTLDLLSIVCSRTNLEEGVSLAECAKEANLAPSTALRFLRSLCARGFAERDEQGLFHPGTELLKLGASVLSRNSLIRIAQPLMRELVKTVNESAYLAVLDVNGNCLYIAIEECSQSIRHVSWVGKTIPSEHSASGKVLTGKVKAGKFARESGFIEEGVTGISSPIVVDGNIVAALTILGPSFRLKGSVVRDAGDELVNAATKISALLG